MAGHLRIEHALPDDPAVDGFSTGEPEVDAFFRERRWVRAGKVSPATYKITTTGDGACVGFVSAAMRKLPWPHESSGRQKKLFLSIYVFGIATAYQGRKVPLPVAATALGLVEAIAREEPSCVGLHLWVRESNERAIGFYRKVGFEADPAGPVQRAPGARHLTMRKMFDR